LTSILQVPDFASADDCATLIAEFQRHVPADDSIMHRPMWSIDLPECEAKEILADWLDLITPLVAERYRIEDCVPEGIATIRWPVGSSLPVHVDNESRTWWRRCMAIVYLNDTFTGGELDLPELGEVIVPRRGLLVVFATTTLHAVREVTAGTRWTATTFFARRGTIREPPPDLSPEEISAIVADRAQLPP
jgi:hypothetical protein